MASSADLVYRFLGIDAGAGVQFDRMAGKTLGLSRASSTAEKAINRLVLGVGALGVTLGYESVKSAMNYQTALVRLQTGAGETAKGLKTVHDQLLKLAGPMGVTVTDMANAMYPIESAGFHAAKGVRILRASIEGAKADGAQVATVADALTTALNAYKISSKQATAVTDGMVAAVARGKTHMEDLAASLGNVLPEAAALNVPLSQVLGAMATMTFQGTNAAKASQYLRFALASLANPTSKAQTELKGLGLTSQALADATAQKGLTGAFLMLEDAVGNKFPKGSAQYLAAMSNIVGGTRGMQAVLELTGRHLQNFQANTNNVSTAMKHAGANVEGWGTFTKTMEHNLESSQAAINAFVVEIGEHLLPVATHVLHWISTTGVSDLKSFGHWVEHNKTLIEGMGVALGATAVGLKGLRIAQSISGTLGRTRSLGSGAGMLGGPVPVYVTNWQGGAGGAAGEAAAAGGAAGKFGRFGRFGLSAVGTVAATASTVNIVTNQLKLHNASIPDRVLNAAGSAMLFGATSGETHGSNNVLPSVSPNQIRTLTDAEKHLKSLGVVGIQFVQTQKQSAAAAKQNVAQLQALNQLLVVNPGLTTAAAKAHDRLALSMRAVVGQAQVEAAMLGNDLGRGLVAGIEAQIPHATMAGQLLVASTVKEMRLAAQAHSPSRATYALGGDLGQGLINGWKDKQVARTLGGDLRNGLTGLSTEITKAQNRLQNDLANRRQLVGQVLSSASLLNVPTMASGYTGQTTRLGDIGQFLKGQARDYGHFAKDLRRLGHRGLSKSLINEIAQMGPTQGLQYAQQILAGGAGGIASLNAYDKRIEHSAQLIGREMYGSRVTSDRRALHSLVDEQKETNRLLRQMVHSDRHGNVALTVNGVREKLTEADAREILKILNRHKRHMGK